MDKLVDYLKRTVEVNEFNYHCLLLVQLLVWISFFIDVARRIF